MYAPAVRFMRGYLAGKTHTGPKAWNVSRMSMPAKDEKNNDETHNEHESKIKIWRTRIFRTGTVVNGWAAPTCFGHLTNPNAQRESPAQLV